MPTYSNTSSLKLESCHKDLQTIFNYVIRWEDNIIVSGGRTAHEQFNLYKKGRKLAGDVWIIEDRSKIVTYKDGVFNKSNHQPPDGSALSTAVDVMPYHDIAPHIRWKDLEGIQHFAGFVLGVARMLKEYGAIEHTLVWGGGWESFFDAPHYELKK